MGLFHEILWMFSTPSAQPAAQNNLFHQSSLLPQPHVLLLHHTSSSILADPQMVLSPCVLLLVYFFQPLFILKLSSTPAVLASKQAFPCLVLQELPSLYFHLKLQVALCTLCAQCRKQQAEGEAFLVPGGVLHAHTVELEGRGGKSNHCCWSQIPGCE